ncbi:DUF3383 family protein [uncultured Helicobacter sp.]|uniref:DUF3383 family protein n=1 Tax=uncultured Helicobacter sp. TaxID=175537 RepID=UPI002604F9E3|nr:DUF3383 family protein [uncultured Helicobacter sp.]
MANKALPLDLIIDVTSVGVKDTFTIGKLNTIIIEKYNEALPIEKFTQVANLQQAQSIFGFDSPVVDFASVYFGFLSKSATKCDYLFVYSWSEADLPAVLKGGKAPALSVLKTLNGGFNITIGKTTATIKNLDLTGATDFANAASLIQQAINGAEGQTSNNNFTDAVVSYSPITGGFIVKSGLKGAGETISYISAPTDGTDISGSLGLREIDGARIIEGDNGANTFAEALKEISDNNGNYYLISPNFEFDDVETDLTAFGQFLNTSNDRFAGVYSWSNPQLDILNSGATQAYEGYNGLIIDNKKQDYQNALLCGIISALDLTKNGGNYNIAFNDATSFQVKAISDRMAYEAMVANKANAPCKFGVLGQDDTIYMDGTILGNKTSSINVYVCNSFLKFKQQIQLFNMFKAQKLIGVRGSQSQAIVYSYLDSVFQEAVNANIIAQGVSLTTTERTSVIDTFRGLVDDISQVIEKLETSGYFYIISDINVTTREISITEAYTANTPAKKIVINNYILGA